MLCVEIIMILGRNRTAVMVAGIMVFVTTCMAQESQSKDQAKQTSDEQVHVSWLYGSYIPKDVPLRSLSNRERFSLYLHQTYLTPGIYAKTAMFALYDQATGSPSEWGGSFGGFAKRLGSRQAQFIIENTLSSLGNGLVRWEPRYDRCRCERFWPRTRHAIVRNFVTYGTNEKSLRPQIMPYLGAFGSSAIATTWEPGHPRWEVRGYQAAITQIFVGVAVNWVGEFAPEIGQMFRKKQKGQSDAGNQDSH